MKDPKNESPLRFRRRFKKLAKKMTESEKGIEMSKKLIDRALKELTTDVMKKPPTTDMNSEPRQSVMLICGL